MPSRRRFARPASRFARSRPPSRVKASRLLSERSNLGPRLRPAVVPHAARSLPGADHAACRPAAAPGGPHPTAAPAPGGRAPWAAVLPPRYHGPVELSVALIQTDAGSDAEANVARAAELADVAATAGAQLIALPE